MAKLYVDGYTIKSNPSTKGGGYVIIRDSKIYKKEIKKKKFTNNEAEVRGLLAATQMASDSDTIFSDSMCALAWIKRGNAKARPDLSNYISRAKDFVISKKLKLRHVCREQNLAGLYIEGQHKNKKIKKKLFKEPVKEGEPCPVCKAKERGGIMMKRKGRYGKFLGCSKYPQCFHVEKIKPNDTSQWDLIQQANAILGPRYKLL